MSSSIAGLFYGDRQTWQRAYTRLLLLLDATVLFLVCVPIALVRFGVASTPLGLPYLVVPYLLIATWMGTLALNRCYEASFVLREAHQSWRVVRATATAFASVSLLCFLTRAEVSRWFVVVVFPLGLLGLLGSRVVARRWLSIAREQGEAQRRVLVVGDAASVERLTAVFDHEADHGHRVVATCVLSDVPEQRQPRTTEPTRLTSLEDLDAAVLEHRVDTVAVGSSVRLGRDALRSIVYAVEGLGVEVLAVPSLTDVAGTRVSVRPVAGLPLLHLDRPELDGAHKFLKSAFDRSVDTLGSLLK